MVGSCESVDGRHAFRSAKEHKKSSLVVGIVGMVEAQDATAVFELMLARS